MSTSQPFVRPSAIERRQKYVPKGVSVQNSITVTRAQGVRLWDADGMEYLDFAGGIGCLNVGHSHPEVVTAVKEQAERFFHTCFHVAMNEPYLQLVEELCRIAPMDGEKKALLANSGAEAVENAIKVSRSYTNRCAVMAFDYAFHGRTNMGLALTSKVHPYKAGFGPFVPEVYRLPFANCYRCPFGQTYGDCGYQCVTAIIQAFDTYVDANDVAAVIVEPVQGEGGFIVPPPDYLPKIRKICADRGILFIVDEVQTGFGRTGKMFSTNHYTNLDPDIVVMAKSLGAGLPISAVVGKAEIMDSTEVGGLGGTYGGNPLAAVAALKVIEVIEREGLAERAVEIGRKMCAVLLELQKRYPVIGDVRAQGAMVAMEFVKSRDTKEPYPEAVSAVSDKCLKNGLVTIKAGVYNNVMRFLMPLIITDEDLEQGLQILSDAVAETAEEAGWTS
ncbi:4-aminobutyrate--2-oxoglutarate transaminase [Alicyclobacillus cycloheptanicus]|uniref:4-aminobutyrate--2-oxoglutarate transaminase n=1 Tax=Alicyclobacillus cycloheptanicus TaxID=1457 RepID=UPI0023782E77|nr:4-aminobutyrate--2-oxoglutarate transaminase [Alicyclobacillus cycloheptanicus]WDM01289.1 4-aminobutyrate--2-oxoglutarate transaminase [Alicyclobacillus cycloheptanicus]